MDFAYSSALNLGVPLLTLRHRHPHEVGPLCGYQRRRPSAAKGMRQLPIHDEQGRLNAA